MAIGNLQYLHVIPYIEKIYSMKSDHAYELKEGHLKPYGWEGGANSSGDGVCCD